LKIVVAMEYLPDGRQRYAQVQKSKYYNVLIIRDNKRTKIMFLEN
jgi:hypothetical protein